jgi:succinate-semialdehyde dehydrogenase / glutarate-semialdehyde dehydrogenase
MFKWRRISAIERQESGRSPRWLNRRPAVRSWQIKGVRIIQKAEELEFAYPDPRRGDMNPFIFPVQASIVDAHLDDAVAKGARIVCGGKSQSLGGGKYMLPTVVTHVDHTMKLMKEETFGPVTPVMSYQNEEEALRLANDSEFGLSGAIIAGDVEEARHLAQELNAGAISLQDSALTESIMQDVEKNSFNMSGMGGSRMGPNSVLRFFRKKALIHNSGPTVSIKSLGEGAATFH